MQDEREKTGMNERCEPRLTQTEKESLRRLRQWLRAQGDCSVPGCASLRGSEETRGLNPRKAA